ncbi:MAG: C-terminal binding protein [Planctomycetota bacterium]|jgi:D-3-phosphoglycerate dehydrogenase
MSKFKVIITDYVFDTFDAEREVLSAVDAELDVHQCKSADELIPHLAGAHAILNTYLPGMDETIFSSAPDLKVIVRYGIGLDTIDVAAATARGVMVANVPDYCIEEVSDHALAHFLSLARKIPFSDRQVKGGQWSLGYLKPMKGITDMTCGVIGFGRIGRAIAQRLKAFGPDVVFADPFGEGDVDGCRHVALDELYAASDAIFVQCPSSEDTHHLINRAAIEKMAKKPFIINCARGAIVDTDAIVWAIENDKIAGAGLDLLDDEDAVVNTDHPLKAFDNVTLTPHSAWYSTAAIGKLQRMAAEEVARVLRGEKPKSLINPEVLDKE